MEKNKNKKKIKNPEKNSDFVALSGLIIEGNDLINSTPLFINTKQPLQPLHKSKHNKATYDFYGMSVHKQIAFLNNHVVGL